MLLHPIDWALIAAFFVVSLIVGLAVTRRAGTSSAEYFAAGRSMPWWLLGTSMVATTFSTDTPNVVTSFVRQNGIAGNWVWWPFLITGMMTVFVFARLWRRSGVLTDLEFYELRYSGKPAAFLRGFRALYLGVIFNVLVMASVCLAAIKIGAVLLQFSPLKTILLASCVTVVYSCLGGLRGVLITDFIQFTMAMAGSIGAAYVALSHPDIGGLSGLLTHEAVAERISLLPDFSRADMSFLFGVFFVPLAVQWWAAWYPGSEPGGGGYIAQRMLAAKDEKNAVGAVMLFNAAHYALRPWPWFIVALCSIIVFPTVDSLKAAFPYAASVAGDDMGYPAMLTFLPRGLMGLVVASLIAAFMSTISTHLNWGSSYLVHDFYQRFIRPKGTEKEMVLVGRVVTVVLMILTGALALLLEEASKNFMIILQVGAGTGLLFILRWFWWRINAVCEVVAMTVSFVTAMTLFFLDRMDVYRPEEWQKFLIIVGVTTPCWLAASLLGPATDRATLLRFCRLVKPGGPGWRYLNHDGLAGQDNDACGDMAWQMPHAILCTVLGCIAIFSTLFATGHWLFGHVKLATGLTLLAVISTMLLMWQWHKLFDEPTAGEQRGP